MKRLIYVLVVLTAIIAMAFSQQSQTYKLQPEDIIRIQVFGIQEFAAELPIGRDGNVTAPFLGIIKAAGKTATEFEADLAREYVRKQRLKDPRISVTIVRYRQIICSIGPAVNRPGPITLRPGDTLLDLINGGSGVLLDNRSDLKRATLQRKSSKELIPVDLYSMLILGDLSQNYPVEDGDVLTVPENTNNRVFVFGAVQQPGPRLFREGMSLSQALIESGGEVPYRTMLSKVRIQRPKPGLPGEYESIQADLTKFFGKNDFAQNVVLKAGDIVFFPDTKTPDANRIGALSTSIANFFFILDRFGVNILGGRR